MVSYSGKSYNADILGVKCPKCQADVRQRCKTNGPTLARIRNPHKGRIELAKGVSDVK